MIPRKKDPYENLKCYNRFSNVYKLKYAKNEERLKRIPCFITWSSRDALEIWQKHRVKKYVSLDESCPIKPRPEIYIHHTSGIFKYLLTLHLYDVQYLQGGRYILRKKEVK